MTNEELIELLEDYTSDMSPYSQCYIVDEAEGRYGIHNLYVDEDDFLCIESNLKEFAPEVYRIDDFIEELKKFEYNLEIRPKIVTYSGDVYVYDDFDDRCS